MTHIKTWQERAGTFKETYLGAAALAHADTHLHVQAEIDELRTALAQQGKQQPVAWYEYNQDLDAWFLAYGHNPKAKTRPLVFGDTAAPAPHEQPDWLLKTTQDLANCIRRRCFPDVPQFQVMGDLAGVISQIGNMTTGMERKAEPQEPHAWMIQGSHATWKGEHAEPANSYDLAKRADNGGQP